MSRPSCRRPSRPGPPAKAKQLSEEVATKIENRVKELPLPRLQAAYLANPSNLLAARLQEKPDGVEKMKVKEAFTRLGRKNPKWDQGLCNAALSYVRQDGVWLDGSLLAMIKTRTVTTFWEDEPSYFLLC